MTISKSKSSSLSMVSFLSMENKTFDKESVLLYLKMIKIIHNDALHSHQSIGVQNSLQN